MAKAKRQLSAPDGELVEEPAVKPAPEPEGPMVNVVSYRAKSSHSHLLDGTVDGKIHYPGSMRNDVAATACNCPVGTLSDGSRGWSALLTVPLDGAADKVTCLYCQAIARAATAPVETTESANGDGPTSEELDAIEAEPEDEPTAE